MTSNSGDTTRRTGRRAAVAGVAAGALALGLVPAASAQPVKEDVRNEFQDSIHDFCESGLTVGLDVLIEGRRMINERKRDRLPYLTEHQRITVVYTVGERTVTERQTVLLKDLRLTDNGDDTVTALMMGTGNATVYDEDGTAIARNPGQTRFELLLDGESFDVIDDLGVVFGSTGRNDDFCAAVVPVLQG